MPEFLALAPVLQHARGALSRPDILRPLTWLIVLILLAIIGLVKWEASPWLIMTVAILLALVIFLYFGAYVFCLLKNPDALRSERYALQKIEFERSIYGDNKSGTFEVDDTSPQAIEASTKHEHRS
jgi:hypothetical protein